MAQLKGVVFGVRDVLVQEGQLSFNKGVLAVIGRFVKFLNARGIQAAAIANSNWTATDSDTGKKQSLRDCLLQNWDVQFEWFVYGKDDFPPKQTSAALEYIRNKMGWEANEMLYIGNSTEDMKSAVNGAVLFLNALWYKDSCEYGFRFQDVREIARFIDIFCLREHWWYFQIEDGPLKVYALAPYSTYKVPEYKQHSENFITAVKNKLGDEEDVDFWAKYLCTSVYFSGVYEAVDYIVPYPGHHSGSSAPSILHEPMSAFAKCFRGKFLSDLIRRHKTSIESKKNRNIVDHLNQLNSIVLNPTPEKKTGENYAKSPLKDGKTVLVVDDILTNGYSFEAARAYIEDTGASVICVGFLKSLNSDYYSAGKIELKNGPYIANKLASAKVARVFKYGEHVVDPEAATELSAKLDAYQAWDWPEG